MQTIAKRLRTELGMNRQEFALFCGVTLATVRVWDIDCDAMPDPLVRLAEYEIQARQIARAAEAHPDAFYRRIDGEWHIVGRHPRGKGILSRPISSPALTQFKPITIDEIQVD